jgi:hypothetical protein
MPVPYERVEKAFRGAGLRSFTKRKLQRWADEPGIEVVGPDGVGRRLGLLSGGRRKGRGYGKGVNWYLSETDLLTAAFIQYALDRMDKHTLGGHGLGDAGLWAFLWGAPVPLPVVRHYLLESLDRLEQRTNERLQSRKKDREDEVFELIDRLAQHTGYDDAVSKEAGVPIKDRIRLGQEVFSSWVGKKWTTKNERFTFFKRFTDEYSQKFTQRLAGSKTANTGQFFENSTPSTIEEGLRFHSFKNLREVYRTCPDERLLHIQATFSTGQQFLDAVSEAIRSKKRIPPPVMERVKDLRAFYNICASLGPGAVVSLMLEQKTMSASIG